MKIKHLKILIISLASFFLACEETLTNEVDTKVLQQKQDMNVDMFQKVPIQIIDFDTMDLEINDSNIVNKD